MPRRRPTTNPALGGALRSARLMAHLTQASVAHSTGLDQTQISKWERGEQTPNLDQIAKLETALGLSRGALLANAGFVETKARPTTFAEIEPTGHEVPDFDWEIAHPADAISYLRAVVRAKYPNGPPPVTNEQLRECVANAKRYRPPLDAPRATGFYWDAWEIIWFCDRIEDHRDLVATMRVLAMIRTVSLQTCRWHDSGQPVRWAAERAYLFDVLERLAVEIADERDETPDWFSLFDGSIEPDANAGTPIPDT